MKKVFIDGSAGTTGLRIRERLEGREDISLILLPEAERKDLTARKKALNEADIAFLCLPDAAAIEAVTLVENENTVIIDTSTAHRTAEGWTYGFPELFGKRQEIKTAKRIANPGCHASGFVALIAPLVKAGILPADTPLTCTSLTGYSGGGKNMIASYEGDDRDTLLDAPRQYGLTQSHKHLKEMAALTGLTVLPCFLPIVGDFYSGMEVTVPLHTSALSCQGDALSEIAAIYEKAYDGKLVHFENADEGGFLSAARYSGRDDMEISVYGNADRVILVARFDNLGKGASGAAIQNMNLVLGVDETEGLVLA